MRYKFTLLLFSCLFYLSCEDIDSEILPIVGVYEGHVVGEAGPFSMNVSAAYGDDITIDAPFDGDQWVLVDADIDDVGQLKWDIDIYHQELAPGIEIWGDGFFYDGSLQLDYTISFFGDEFDYKLIASKY